MTKLSKKSEQFISFSILVFSILLSAFLIHKYLFSLTNKSNQPESIQAVSKQISLPDINWSEQPKTLVIALQTSCHFCNESASFYRRLIETVKGKNIKLVAVLPNDIVKSRVHLDKLGLTNLDVRQASLDSVQVNGTPTLILINDKGEIINSWVGKLPPDEETEVIRRLNSEG